MIIDTEEKLAPLAKRTFMEQCEKWSCIIALENKTFWLNLIRKKTEFKLLLHVLLISIIVLAFLGRLAREAVALSFSFYSIDSCKQHFVAKNSSDMPNHLQTDWLDTNW